MSLEVTISSAQNWLIARAAVDGAAYEIRMGPDDSVLYVRERFNPGGVMIESKSAFTTLDDLRYDPNAPPIVVWLARGLGGIPQGGFR